MRQYPIDKYKFHVYDRTVIAETRFAGRKVKAKAICSPNDEFDLETGKKLAAARCNVKVAEMRSKRALDKYGAIEDKLVELSRKMVDSIEYSTSANWKKDAAYEELEEIMESLT